MNIAFLFYDVNINKIMASRHPLENKVPLDIWREIKKYIVHNIKTQGKHLKKEKSILLFNRTLLSIPRIKPPTSGPQIIISSNNVVKYLYHIQAVPPTVPVTETPLPYYRDGIKTIIVTSIVHPEVINNPTVSVNIYLKKDYINYYQAARARNL